VVKRNAARAEFSAERRALKAAALRPVLDLIRADPSAAAAAHRLNELNQQLLSPHLSRPYGNPVPGPVPLMVGQGTQVFIPPYDHAQVGPVDPSGGGLGGDLANPLTGDMHIYPPVDIFYDGTYSVTVGLGVDLQTSEGGWLEITPLAKVCWSAGANGSLLDSHVEAHVITSAMDVAKRAPTGNSPTDYELFSLHSDSDPPIQCLSLSAPYIAIAFWASARAVYQIWFNVAVYGDQSGNLTDNFGSSVALAEIEVEIPFFVTNLSN
jgi:hypothetical protein